MIYALIGVKTHEVYATADYKSMLNCQILELWPNRERGLGSRLSGKPLNKSRFAVPFPETMRIVRTNWRDE